MMKHIEIAFFLLYKVLILKLVLGFLAVADSDFPEYFYNATRNNLVALKSVATSMGYTNDQVEALVNFNN